MSRKNSHLAKRLAEVESAIGPVETDATPEAKVVKFRAHARKLTWSALVLIVVSGLTPYFFGSFVEPWQNLALIAGAVLLVFMLVIGPFFRWLTRTTVVTTRRIIMRSGFFTQHRGEVRLAQVREIKIKRGVLQRMWKTGDIVLQAGVTDPIMLRNVPRVAEIAPVLQELIERQYLDRN